MTHYKNQWKTAVTERERSTIQLVISEVEAYLGLRQPKLLAFHSSESSIYHADYELTLWLDNA